MGDKSRIEWCDATYNPITGCSPVSEACRNCYASRMIGRNLPKMGHVGPFSQVQFHPDRLDQPLRWKKPRRIFVCSMGDLFHEDVPMEWLDKVFDVMEGGDSDYRNGRWCPGLWHTFMILTKRPDRMKSYIEFRLGKKQAYADQFKKCPTAEMQDSPAARWAQQAARGDFYPIWLGVTAENQEMADQRIPILLQTPAAVRFVSVEPMLGRVDLKRYLFGAQARKVLLDAGGSLEGLPAHLVPPPSLDWVICGGESGPGARPLHPDWPRSLRDQCQSAGVPFFFKQWGEWADAQTAGIHQSGPVMSKKGAVNDWMRQRVRFADGREAVFQAHRWTAHATNLMFRVGKKDAGCLLDGRAHKQFPTERGRDELRSQRAV